jgi:ATP-dependent Clp protease protease subunit
MITPTKNQPDEDPDKEKKENEGMKPDQPMAPVQMALFKSRTVLIFGEIDMKVAERVCGQLLAYAAEGSGDIRVIINSPG